MKTATGERRILLISWPHVMAVFGLVLSLSVILDFNRRLAATQRIVSDAQQLNTEVAGLQAQQATLRAELAYASSDTYVERWARDEGKLAKPGEVLVVPLAPPGPTATPVPARPPILSPPVAEAPTWSLWWALFFSR